jgi:hypothetical protein
MEERMPIPRNPKTATFDDSMRQLEDFTRRVLAVPKDSVDKAAAKLKRQRKKKRPK